MNTELQQRIAAIKEECEEILRQEQLIAGPGKWEAQLDDTGKPCIMCDEYYVAEMTMLAPGNGKDCTMQENAAFIAHSRNVSPAMARVVLATIRWFEELGEHRSVAPLEHLANQWEGK